MREIRKDAAFLSGVKLEETLILYAATMYLDNIVVGPNQGTLLCREIGGLGNVKLPVVIGTENGPSTGCLVSPLLSPLQGC